MMDVIKILKFNFLLICHFSYFVGCNTSIDKKKKKLTWGI